MSDTGNRGGGSRFLYEPFGGGIDPQEREYRDILRGFGTPEQVRHKMKALDEMLEERRRRDWLLGSVKRIAGWAAVVAAGWLAFKGVLTQFIVDLQQ